MAANQDRKSSNKEGFKWLTEDALLVCDHELGHVKNDPTHDLVTVGRRRVLVDHDPESRPIQGCPNIGATIKPCTNTLKVDVGYSEFIKVQGRRVCLDTVSGFRTRRSRYPRRSSARYAAFVP